MALSADELAQIRRMVSDADQEFWSDLLLQDAAEAYVSTDGSYDLRSLAASLWEEKAAAWAKMVNTSESGSSRSMSQQFDHAIVMAKRFRESGSDEPADTSLYPRSTRIVRPTREG